MPTPITTDQVKKLSEFDTATLTDEHLLPTTNPLGTVGGKTTVAALRDFILQGIELSPMTIDEYDDISEKKDTLYFIVDDEGRLERIYYKHTLVAIRGEEPDADLGFPLVFPFVFV